MGSKSKIRAWMMGLGLIFVAMALLVRGIHITHMHPDEHLGYFFTRDSLNFLWWYLGAQDTHPPLWFSSFWLWRHVMGDSEFLARLFAVFLSMITLSLIYQVGRRWFGAPRFGLFAIALLAVNAFFFYHSLEIRPYALIMLLATASMWSFERWLARPTRRRAVIYAATLAAMLYVHYFLFVLILAQGLYFLLTQRLTRQRLAQAVLVGAIAFALWLPWFPWAVNQVGNLRQAELSGGNQRGIVGAGTTTVPTSLDTVIDLLTYATNGSIVLYLVILASGFALLRRQRNYRLALMWGVGAPALSFLLNMAIAVYTPRYVLYMVIGFGLLIGAALAALPGRGRLLALAAVVLLSIWTLPGQLPQRTPYRDLYQRVSAQARPNDVIFFDHADAGARFVRWQIDHYLAPELFENRAGSLENARQQRRIWYAVNEEWVYNPEVKPRFAQLERTHPVQTVIGDCTSAWCYLIQLMEAPPLAAPLTFGETMPFWGADVYPLENGVLPVRLWWKVEQTPELDYSIGVQLIAANGSLVAQADGPIHDQYLKLDVPSSQLEPGRIYIDQRRVTLPPGLPAENYQIMLVVYQSWDGMRLKLPDGSEALRLGQFTP